MLVQHSHNVRGEKKTGNARKNKNARGNLKDVTPVRAVCRSGQKRSEYKSAKSVFAEGSKQFVQKAAVRFGGVGFASKDDRAICEVWS